MSTWDIDISYTSPDDEFKFEFRHKWESRITGLVGSSGSGKTTLIEVLLGLRDAKRIKGHAIIDGRTIFNATTNPPTRERKLTWIPQENTLFPHMTVGRNLAFASDVEEEIDKVSDKLKLDILLDKLPEELSGGQRQKVALARALLTKSDTILLDEPLNALDKKVRSELVEWLKDSALTYNRNFLYVSHDPAEISALCDYVIEIDEGKIVCK